MLPGLVTVMGFFLIPAGYVVYLSLFRSTIEQPAAQYVGVRNYGELLHSSDFGSAIVHTIVFAVGVTILVIACGLMLAALLDKGLRGTNLYRSVFFLPYVVPLVSSGIAFSWLLQPQYGFVAVVLRALGLPVVNWLGNVHTALLSVIMVTVWEYLGFYMLIFLSAMQGVDVTLKEAAAVDGANKITVFWKITMPAITPALFFAAVFGVIQSFQAFDQIYVMTQGGPALATSTLTYYIFSQGFQFFDFGKAAAASVAMMVILGALTASQFLFSRRWVVTDQ
jgi:multiple sugar transport system permease protein/sn-glycerol 3-phosphate transport system permease protein